MTRLRARVLFLASALAVMAGALAVSAHAQEENAAAEIVLRADAQPTVMTIGDDVICTVHLEYAGSIEAVTGLRESALMLGQFEVKNYTWQKEPVLKDGRYVTEDTYIISTYVTGDYEIPPFTASYRKKDGTSGTVSTQPIRIKVNSVLTSESDAEDIQDIAPPAAVGMAGLTKEARVAVALIAVALIALIIGILALFRATRPAPAAPPRPAHEIALERFELLRKGEMIAPGREKEFATVASDILREYLNNRYGLEARDMTTTEIDKWLRFTPETEALVEPVTRFLEFADRIKFAKYIPADDEKANLLTGGEDFVRATARRNDEPAAAIAGAKSEEAAAPEVEPELVGAAAEEEKAS